LNLSTPFIKRPIATTLLALGVALFGIVAWILLPVSSLPQVEFPTISVQANLPGASPEIMSSAVATPLERQFARIAGITQMTSSSSIGAARITLQFELSRNIDGAARDVQAAINAARAQLPTDLPSNPSYRKVNPADAPILIISLTSDRYSRTQMYDLASTVLQQKLAQVEGIGQVFIGGGASPAVRVELNPMALNQYGIPLERVRAALGAANVNQAKGQLEQGSYTAQLITNDQLFSAYQYKPLILSYQNNAPIRLSDVAAVEDSVENTRTAGISNGKPAVMVVLYKQPNANVIETVERVKKMLPQFSAYLPAHVQMRVVLDRTTAIRASLHDVEITLLIAILLVTGVVYLFLGSLRSALIPSVAVPLSLLGTCSVMYLLGYSLNNLSLMALTIATGFVIDDAVVVLENIERHIEAGMRPLQAAFRGTQEVSFTVLSMSIALIAVFIPILCMGGIVGRLFHEFAMSLSIAIGMSLIVSLTVTPMMCAMLLRLPQKTAERQKSVAFFSVCRHKARSAFTHFYQRSLRWSLNHTRSMLAITFAAVLLTVYLFTVVPKGFFPQQDSGRITASIQGDQSISFQAMEKKLQDFIRIVSEDPAVENTNGFIGGGGSVNSGSIFITLKPPSLRNISGEGVIKRLRQKLEKVPSATLYMQVAQDLVVGGRQGNAQFQYTLSADSLPALNFWAPKVMEVISRLPNIVDVSSDQQNNGLQVAVQYDHDKAAQLGISTEVIDQTLYDAFGQRQVSIIYKRANQYHVVMEVAPEYSQRIETLQEIYVPSNTGKRVPLSTFATFVAAPALLSINHQDQFPSATFSFNLQPGASLGDVVTQVNQAVAAMRLPQTVQGAFQGSAQSFQSALSSQPYLIILALFTVYIVLGILYESLIHPITILSTLPSAGVGAFLALLLTRTDLSIIAMIGIILLIGIVKKNAIMMVDFALQLKKKGYIPISPQDDVFASEGEITKLGGFRKGTRPLNSTGYTARSLNTPRDFLRDNASAETPILKSERYISSEDAIYQAALLRVRPIMMTTAAAMLGALPLAIGFGVGAELRQPLGITIIGGLMLSQMLTLYSTPVIYLALDKIGGRRRTLLGQQAPPKGA
jgi:multidrug efflux pump